MLSTLTVFPAKPITAITTVENPKTLILQQCKTSKDLNQIHAHLIKTRLIHNRAITENLLESAAILLPNTMDYALSIFDDIGQPDSSAYNVMIRGLTYKQSPHDAIFLFKKMLETSVEPDEFTFPCVLKACSRLRALSEGYMKSGCWEEVVKLFHRMRELNVGFDEVTMISVLTSCGRSADLELGEWINGYIEANGIKKSLALMTSLVDMYAKCDDGHAHLKEIYGGVEDMMKQIKSAGYVPNPTDARLDAEEDDKEASVSHHSEKLAIAFGLIRTPPGTTIRISKNLRVCTDCHNATKIISKVYNREIVVRDRNRFHHFKEGLCSCNDYW
nr:pentatricopeptide repeat-containing protein eli1, chloroplastic [Quercus suber]